MKPVITMPTSQAPSWEVMVPEKGLVQDQWCWIGQHGLFIDMVFTSISARRGCMRASAWDLPQSRLQHLKTRRELAASTADINVILQGLTYIDLYGPNNNE